MKNLSPAFTLIEISIVLALLMLIMTISLPGIWFLKQQTVACELEKLNMAFAYLQQAAITSNKNLNLKFDLSTNSYSYENYHEKLSKKIIFGTISGVKGSPSTITQTISNPITFTNNQVTFYANGKIQPGSVYLVDSAKQFMFALTIPVSQVSFIRKYKYQDNKWILI